jgi:hypothetical protein
MKTNLKTEQGRKSAIEEIEKGFIKSLRQIGVELSNEVTVDINDVVVEVYHDNASFSVVIINAKRAGRENSINLASSSSFAPENKEPYWRTIHAASILKNWDKVCESVNHHCKLYSELVEEIKNQNPS